MSSFSIEAARENMDNSHEVFSKPPFAAEQLLVKKLNNCTLTGDPFDGVMWEVI